MKTPFERLAYWLAQKLGYVRHEELGDALWEAEMYRADLMSAEAANHRGQVKLEELRQDLRDVRTKELQPLEDQLVRYQALANESLTARANQIKYGIPFDQSFGITFQKHKDFARDSEVYTLSIAPKHQRVSFHVNGLLYDSVQDSPEAFVRQAMPALIAQFEASLGRELHAAVRDARVGA